MRIRTIPKEIFECEDTQFIVSGVITIIGDKVYIGKESLTDLIRAYTTQRRIIRIIVE